MSQICVTLKGQDCTFLSPTPSPRLLLLWYSVCTFSEVHSKRSQGWGNSGPVVSFPTKRLSLLSKRKTSFLFIYFSSRKCVASEFHTAEFWGPYILKWLETQPTVTGEWACTFISILYTKMPYFVLSNSKYDYIFVTSDMFMCVFHYHWKFKYWQRKLLLKSYKFMLYPSSAIFPFKINYFPNLKLNCD